MTASSLVDRRQALACAMGLLRTSRHSSWLALSSWAAIGNAQPVPNADVQRAKSRLDALNGLRSATRAFVSDTKNLREDLAEIAAEWQKGEATSSPAQTEIPRLRAVALPDLWAAQQAWTSAAMQADSAVAAHLNAVADFGVAALADRPTAIALADMKAAERRQAKAVYNQASKALAPALGAALGSTTTTVKALEETHTRHLKADAKLTQTAIQWAELHDLWQDLQRRGLAGVNAGWLAEADFAGTGLDPPKSPWARPSGTEQGPKPLENVYAALLDWDTAMDAAQLANRTRWVGQDAGAFLRRTLQAEPTDCFDTAGTVCGGWHAEQRMLAEELPAQQNAAATAKAQLMSAQTRADAWPAKLQAQGQALHSWRDRLAAAAETIGSVEVILEAAIASGLAAVRHVDTAYEAATRAYVVAWRAQFGIDPPWYGSGNGRALSGGERSGVRPALGGGRLPGAVRLERHALHCMTEFDDEPTGFGAYTYVLVGTGMSRDSSGVAQRLQSLLSALIGLMPAKEVTATKRASSNSFVVPAPELTPERNRLDYNVRLGQALMSHVPPGLLLPGAARRALITGNGPFLVTLPGRVADAQADWPLLFADLSQVPAAVVADVVRSYQGDLLSKFDVTREAWKPPAPQQVALALVRLVKGTGDLVQAAFPAAVSAPARR